MAADTTVRNHGLPCAVFWERVVRHRPNVILHDDKQSMIAVARTGKNPTMRHLERTHGVSVAWLHEMFKRDEYALVHELSSKMAADICTKASLEACVYVGQYL